MLGNVYIYLSKNHKIDDEINHNENEYKIIGCFGVAWKEGNKNFYRYRLELIK